MQLCLFSLNFRHISHSLTNPLCIRVHEIDDQFIDASFSSNAIDMLVRQHHEGI